MHFNTANTLDIIAPGLIEQSWSEARVLGSAVWLWMHSAFTPSNRCATKQEEFA